MAGRRGRRKITGKPCIGTTAPNTRLHVLKSLKDGKFYTGYTENLKLRLEQYNSGQVSSMLKSAAQFNGVNQKPAQVAFNRVNVANKKKIKKKMEGRLNERKLFIILQPVHS